MHPDGSGLKRITPHGDFCGSPKWEADSKRVVAYCMTAEQTLDNRRPAPEHPEDTRIVSIDIATGTMSDLASWARRELQSVAVSASDLVGYIRQDGSERGIHYSTAARGPVGRRFAPRRGRPTVSRSYFTSARRSRASRG